jgi:plasmid stabilization system protein ParE
VKRRVFWSRDALDELNAAIGYIAADNPAAAMRLEEAIRAIGEALGEMATGRPGRISGTYERVVVGLPYILAYALHALPGGDEAVVILRVVHGARDWPEGEWPD